MSDPEIVQGPRPIPGCPTARRSIVLSVVLFTLSIALVASLRPELVVENGFGFVAHTGLLEEDFYRRKVGAGDRFDVVVGGDSRTVHGVAPESLSRAAGAAAVLNFAFASAVFTPEYLDALTSHLRPRATAFAEPRDAAGRARAVILGISPAALTRNTASRNAFDHYRRTRLPAAEAAILGTFGAAIRRFEPLPPLTAWPGLAPAWFTAGVRPAGAARGVRRLDAEPEPERVTYRWHADLWIEATVRSPGSWNLHRDDRTIRDYESLFRKTPVDPARIAALLEAVARWTRDGVTVLAFRPPVSVDLAMVENGIGGFDERALEREITRRGGGWLRVAGAGFPSYDGSHLDSIGAHRLSTRLGAALAGGVQP